MRALFPLLLAMLSIRWPEAASNRWIGSSVARHTARPGPPARRGPEAVPASARRRPCRRPPCRRRDIPRARTRAANALLGKPQALRTDAAQQFADRRRRQDRAVGAPHHHASATPFKRKQVHRRRADEAGGKTGRRARIDLCRRRVLFDMAIAQQHDLVGHAHGLGLVVRHVQHGDPQPTLQRQDLAPHVGTKLRIEVRQRFIHQADRCLGNDGAAEGHTLLLAAGKLAGLALQQMSDAENLDRARQPPRALGRRNTARLQPEHDILRDVQMGEQAHRTGTPSPRRVPRAARSSRRGRRSRSGPRSPSPARRRSAGRWSCRIPTGPAARRSCRARCRSRRRAAPPSRPIAGRPRSAAPTRRPRPGARAEMSRRGA